MYVEFGAHISFINEIINTQLDNRIVLAGSQIGKWRISASTMINEMPMANSMSDGLNPETVRPDHGEEKNAAKQIAPPKFISFTLVNRGCEPFSREARTLN